MQKNTALIRKITDFISDKNEQLNRNGAVIAFSGGLDSAVCAALAVRALGKESVILINLPERDSKTRHQKHARQFAKILGCKFIRHSLTGLLFAAGTYSLLPISLLPSRKMRGKLVEYARDRVISKNTGDLLETRLNSMGTAWVARGNAYAMAKHRLRMVWVYQYAETHNLLVIGAANRTEWLTGTFSKWGIDHCADIMPILHLFRTQVEELAEELDIPKSICEKPADPDILPGIADKNILLGNFREVDDILKAYLAGRTKNEMRQKFDEDLVEKLITLIDLSQHMRMSPYHLLNTKNEKRKVDKGVPGET